MIEREQEILKDVEEFIRSHEGSTMLVALSAVNENREEDVRTDNKIRVSCENKDECENLAVCFSMIENIIDHTGPTAILYIAKKILSRLGVNIKIGLHDDENNEDNE